MLFKLGQTKSYSLYDEETLAIFPYQPSKSELENILHVNLTDEMYNDLLDGEDLELFDELVFLDDIG